MPSPNRRLHSVRSSPQLILNEIFEEGESDGEGGSSGHGNTNTMCHLRQNTVPNNLGSSVVLSSPVDMRKHRLARARTASCSSSEASDDEDGKKKRVRARQYNSGSREGRELVSSRIKDIGINNSSSRSGEESNSLHNTAVGILTDDGDESSMHRMGKDSDSSRGDCNKSSSAWPVNELSEEDEREDSVPGLKISSPLGGGLVGGKNAGSKGVGSSGITGSSSSTCSSGGSRPLSAACHEPRNSPAKKETCSSTEMLDIDSTLRESRSLNCIVKASGEEETDDNMCSISVSSLVSESNNITVTNDNVTTIYIGENQQAPNQQNFPALDIADSQWASDKERLLDDDNGKEGAGKKVVIHIKDHQKNKTRKKDQKSGGKVMSGAPYGGITVSAENLLYERTEGDSWQLGGHSKRYDTAGSVVHSSDVILGIVDTPPTTFSHQQNHHHSDPSLPVPGVPYPNSSHLEYASPNTGANGPQGPWVVLPPRPTSHPPVLLHRLPNSSGVGVVGGDGISNSANLTKSASHMDTLVKLKPSKLAVRSTTNGSITPTSRNHYLMDINQNAGGASATSTATKKSKSSSEKSTSLAIHGSSKCCTIS